MLSSEDKICLKTHQGIPNKSEKTNIG